MQEEIAGQLSQLCLQNQLLFVDFVAPGAQVVRFAIAQRGGPVHEVLIRAGEAQLARRDAAVAERFDAGGFFGTSTESQCGSPGFQLGAKAMHLNWRSFGELGSFILLPQPCRSSCREHGPFLLGLCLALTVRGPIDPFSGLDAAAGTGR